LSLQGTDRAGTDIGFWLSLAYALVHGAVKALQIERADLEVTLVPQPDNSGQDILIYDAVPGGAGHCRHIIEDIERVVEHARDMLAACDCEPSATGCYGCLCDYSNQWAHDQLSRGDALNYLNLLSDAVTQDGQQPWRQGKFSIGELGDSLIKHGDRTELYVPNSSPPNEAEPALIDWCEIAERLHTAGKSPVHLVLDVLPTLDESIASTVAYRKLQVLQSLGVMITVSNETVPPIAIAYKGESPELVWQWQMSDALLSDATMRRSRAGFAQQALSECQLPNSKPATFQEPISFRHFQIDPAIRSAPQMNSPDYLGDLFSKPAGRIKIVDPYLIHSERNSLELINFLRLINPGPNTNVQISTKKMSLQEARKAKVMVEEHGRNPRSINYTDISQQSDMITTLSGMVNFEVAVSLFDGRDYDDHDRVILWETQEDGASTFYRVLLGHGLVCFSRQNRKRSEGVFFEITRDTFEAQS
jgi:hypothetical protein